jgi:hypothetical protein
MARLRQEEIRRLLSHLRQRISDAELLAQIEDELRSDDGEEFLRKPEILAHFPALTESLTAGGLQWHLRVIPHAHLRMVQRGVKPDSVKRLFQRFVENSIVSGEVISPGPYAVAGRPEPRSRRLSLRVDIDLVTDIVGEAHVVTLFLNG